MLTREGDERLSGKSDVRPSGAKSFSPQKGRKVNDPSGSVGRALRTVYDEMLREEVPQDFLDLLGKLD